MEQTAIVIGGGMGGLATAQVLSTHFTSVVLIEKDQPQPLQGLSAVEAWRMGVEARPGVSQVSCMHTCNT
jgi:phytoene dehydrogenase-like protein